jgi:hypothetical protein
MVENAAELVYDTSVLTAPGDWLMFRKTLLAGLTIAALAVGVFASATAPASADVGIFFNDGQQYYGQSYYGLYPYSSGSDYYTPYFFPPDYDAPGYDYRVYHYHPQYHSAYYHGDPMAACARFHTYNPVTHTYVGKGGVIHHCP